MLATALKLFDVDANEILKSNENSVLLNELSRFSRLVAKYGYTVTPYSESALKKLDEVPSQKKEQIATYFKNWSNWIDPEQNPEPLINIELHCLKKALDFYNLEATDEFLKTIGDDHIVELYGEDMIQLYRSLSFFNVTSYSLLDISIYEWYVLWNRSVKAIEETLNDAQQVIKNYIPLRKFEIQKQLIQEVYDVRAQAESFAPRMILAEFMYFGSLTKKNEFAINTPRGFICTSTARVLDQGANFSGICFI